MLWTGANFFSICKTTLFRAPSKIGRSYTQMIVDNPHLMIQIITEVIVQSSMATFPVKPNGLQPESHE